MQAAWHRFAEGVRRVLRVLVLFAIARAVFGVALILVFEREAVAWGYEATLVVVAAFVVYLAVGLAVRRGAHRARCPAGDATAGTARSATCRR